MGLVDDQSRFFENFKVLLDGGARDGQSGGDLSDRQRLLCEPLEHLSPRRIGQRRKGAEA